MYFTGTYHNHLHVFVININLIYNNILIERCAEEVDENETGD